MGKILNITLNEDFIIDGDLKGAWTIVKGTNNVNYLFGEVKYHKTLLCKIMHYMYYIG